MSRKLVRSMVVFVMAAQCQLVTANTMVDTPSFQPSSRQLEAEGVNVALQLDQVDPGAFFPFANMIYQQLDPCLVSAVTPGDTQKHKDRCKCHLQSSLATQGFIATVVPEPSVIALLTLGSIFTFRTAWRRKRH